MGAPIDLPPLAQITRDEIADWIREHLPRLNNALTAPVLADAIWAVGEQGVPERLFDEFCRLFNTTWETEARKCLQLRK